MLLKTRGLLVVSTLLIGTFASSRAFAQAAGAIDCSKPLPAVPNDWMNTTVTAGGTKGLTTVTPEGDHLVVKAAIGSIWLQYSFKPQDIKSVEEGGNEDGIIGITIDVAPFQFLNSRGETTQPAGVKGVTIDMPAESADQAVAGFQFLHQKAVCAK
jgi:hypothetical protein